MFLESQLETFLNKLTMGDSSKCAFIDSHARNILWANILGSTAKSNIEMGTFKFVSALNKSYERMKKQGNL